MIAKQVTVPAVFSTDSDDRPADDGLMARVAGDDRAAFGRIVRRHRRWLTDWCTRLTGDDDDGGEVAHEVFIRLWEHRRSYRPQGKLRGLLTALARNAAHNRQRAARRRAHWHQQLEHRGHRPSDATADAQPLSALLARERRSVLLRQVDRLPRKQREALRYRFAQDLDYAEIAAIIGRPEATVRSQVHHGLRRLRMLLVGAAIVLVMALVGKSEPDDRWLMGRSRSPVVAASANDAMTVRGEQSLAYPVWALADDRRPADVTPVAFEADPEGVSTDRSDHGCQCRVPAPELYPL